MKKLNLSDEERLKKIKQKILVTGGAGYIGSFAVKELINQGYDVIVLDNMENGHYDALDGRAKLEIADLKDKKMIGAIFKKYQPLAVIDFAAYLAVGESMEKPQKYLKNNVFNFINLLDVMAENNCRYIIKSSTASTYGNPAEKYFPLKENYHNRVRPRRSALLIGNWQKSKLSSNLFFNKIIHYYLQKIKNRPELKLTAAEITKLRVPASIYGLTKLLDEIIMKKYENIIQIKWIALRYFNVCGGDPHGTMGDDKPVPTNLMALCFCNILGQLPILPIYGNDYPTKDGSGIRDYIHPLDLASAHTAALKYLTTKNKSAIFNLGTGRAYSVFEVINAVEKASGKKVNFQIAPRRAGDPAVSCADPSRANKFLNWQSKYDLTFMAESAWRWHSTHPKGYAR